MFEKEKLIEFFETEQYIVGLRSDGIIHVYYKDNVEITINLQIELTGVFNKMCVYEKRLFIFQAGHNCSVNKPARDNAIAIQNQVPAIAYVVYVQNLVYKMIANFYYKFNKPSQAFYVATDFKEGIDWLHAIKVNQNQTSNS